MATNVDSDSAVTGSDAPGRDVRERVYGYRSWHQRN